MSENDSRSVQTPWTRWLVIIQLVWMALALLAVAGSKLSMLPWRPALLTVAAAVVGMALTGLLALLILLQSFIQRGSGLGRTCSLAAFLSVFPLAGVMFFGLQGANLPPIHDISTDTEHPPLFIAAKTLRRETDHAPQYPGEEVARLQRQGYPHIQPLQSALSPGTTYTRCLKAARTLEWQILDENQAEGRIEAMTESLLFGFKDDIVIRITAEGTGSRIDIRSASRVGVSDLGVNAKRITDFFDTFKAAAD